MANGCYHDLCDCERGWDWSRNVTRNSSNPCYLIPETPPISIRTLIRHSTQGTVEQTPEAVVKTDGRIVRAKTYLCNGAKI